MSEATKLKECITFDDVLLVPPYSSVRSRTGDEISTATDVGGCVIDIPLISSPMDTVTEVAMVVELSRLGGMGILHRFMTKEEQAAQIDQVIAMSDNKAFIVPAIGVTDDERSRFKYLWNKYGKRLDMVAVDIANGHHILMSEMVGYINKISNNEVKIMAGNVATADGYRFLSEDLGVDAVRVGIGGGCFTKSTKVLMADGSYKNINKIIPGEFVINRYGEPVKVNKVINNGFKRVYILRTSSWAEDIYVTPDHRFLCVNLSNYACNAKLSEPEWKPISEISEEFAILFPRNINNFDDKPFKSLFLDSHQDDFGCENNIYTSILSLEDTYLEQETWDIEVDCESHSFIANNSIVHNSICKTRIQTGFGIPTLQSIIDCASIRSQCRASIIADGGIKYPSDLVKSLVAGADAIIAGSLFAGTKEAPGDIIYTNDGAAWKRYRGMASKEVQEDRRGGLKPGTVAEGVSQLTKYKGSLARVVNEFVGGLRSGMSYANARTIEELRLVEMVRITNSGLNESHAHGTRSR